MMDGKRIGTRPLKDLLERLIGFDSGGLPVISLYLNAQANQHGRDQYERFIRNEFSTRAKTFEPHTPEGKSFRQSIDDLLVGK